MLYRQRWSQDSNPNHLAPEPLLFLNPLHPIVCLSLWYELITLTKAAHVY